MVSHSNRLLVLSSITRENNRRQDRGARAGEDIHVASQRLDPQARVIDLESSVAQDCCVHVDRALRCSGASTELELGLGLGIGVEVEIRIGIEATNC